jgi:hypothetical protein
MGQHNETTQWNNTMGQWGNTNGIVVVQCVAFGGDFDAGHTTDAAGTGEVTFHRVDLGFAGGVFHSKLMDHPLPGLARNGDMVLGQGFFRRALQIKHVVLPRGGVGERELGRVRFVFLGHPIGAVF